MLFQVLYTVRLKCGNEKCGTIKNATVENAGLENAGPKCRGGQCGTRCIKFEVSSSAHFEDRKGDAKSTKLGGFGQLGYRSLKVIGNSTIR